MGAPGGSTSSTGAGTPFARRLTMTAAADGLDGAVSLTARLGSDGVYHGTPPHLGTLKGCANAPYDSGAIEFVASGRGEEL